MTTRTERESGLRRASTTVETGSSVTTGARSVKATNRGVQAIVTAGVKSPNFPQSEFFICVSRELVLVLSYFLECMNGI